MIPAPVFIPKEEKKKDIKPQNKIEGTYYSSDFSSAATIGYHNKQTVSSEDSIEDKNKPVTNPTSKYAGSNKVDKIDEV